MRKLVRSRRIIALTTAYVVALQALLLPLSVAANASFAASLCAASAEGSQPTGSDDIGCPSAAGCGMACCVQALMGPPQGAVALGQTYVRATLPAPAIEPIVMPTAKGPQIPRAPPPPEITAFRFSSPHQFSCCPLEMRAWHSSGDQR